MIPATPTIEDKQAPRMTLEAFRTQKDPTGFYTKSELISLFEEEQGIGSNDRAARRVARWRERQLEALWWIEELARADPNPADTLTIHSHLFIRFRIRLLILPGSTFEKQ